MGIQQMLLGVGGVAVEKTATLSYPSAHGQFYNTTAVDLSESDLTTGIELDTNDSSASTIAYPGAYKLVLGAAMTLEFHLWGGGSTFINGNDRGASGGGYTKYVCTFSKDDEIGIYIAGFSYSLPQSTYAGLIGGGWPDGGSVGGTSNHGFGGNGSTRVGPIYADLSAMNNSSATYYAIAGGAGGPHMYAINSGAGGGSSGASAPTGDYSAVGGGGGTQSAGGTGGPTGYGSGYVGTDGAKYQGGDGGPYASYSGGGAGGGGYYGGGSGYAIYASGGGGSGYINTSQSGYQSGSTTAGVSGTSTAGGTSPAGSGVTKPTNGPGNAHKNGGVIIKLN